jgi:Uma2 family endonuclease
MHQLAADSEVAMLDGAFYLFLQHFKRDRQDFHISGDLTGYYNEQQLKKRDFCGPDVFVVMGAEKRDRL